jgi:hypothetical protein
MPVPQIEHSDGQDARPPNPVTLESNFLAPFEHSDGQDPFLSADGAIIGCHPSLRFESVGTLAWVFGSTEGSEVYSRAATTVA